MKCPKHITRQAFSAGFSFAKDFDPRAVILREEVRDACAENKCGYYNALWSCPPACGSLEHWAARLREYDAGLLTQTAGTLRDPFDYEAMTLTGKQHALHLARFAAALSKICPKALLLGAGPCQRCAVCAYPTAPCRAPEGPRFSMEATGITVSELCAGAALPYYRGPNTITYTACLLLPARLRRFQKLPAKRL
jgi:predicted metal-binding protein